MAGSPYYDGFRPIRLAIDIRKFRRMPRHPGYKYEYMHGRALISPRVRTADMMLDLEHPRPAEPSAEQSRGMRGGLICVEPIREGDWDEVIGAFHGSFWTEEPFRQMSRRRAVEAARACIDHTRGGGAEAPLIGPACLLARNAEGARRDVVGAALVTLENPPHLIARLSEQFRARLVEGRVPHLTWLFVMRNLWRRGVATALLERTGAALRGLGHSCLASTTTLGNDASLLWHWRNGFELLDQGFSVRVAVADDGRAPESSPVTDRRVEGT